MRRSSTRSSDALVRAGAVVTLALCGIFLALLTAELGLRAAGFQFSRAPKIEFGWPDPVSLANEFSTDPDLFWVPKNYGELLARARREHPAVVFMGDSCTQLGTYPERTIERLKTIAPALATGVNLGVAGWSSQQGLAQLRRDVLPLGPRVVTIYYGWNDHWVALGATDVELARRGTFLSRLRLVQLWDKVGAARAPQQAERQNRVDLQSYRNNLVSMVDMARSIGSAVVLITAPSNHVAGHEPEYLAKRHLRGLGDLVPLHQAYMAATRDMALETGAELCDIAAVFDRLPGPRDQYFRGDGIHLTAAGDEAIATVLAPCIARAAEPIR